MSVHPFHSLRRIAVGAGALLSLALVSAPAALADWETAKQPCSGESIQGRGASFQNNANTGFNGVFRSADGCAGLVATVPQVFYDPAGSGAGRASLGARTAANPNQDRDPAVRFAGTDEPPTPAERLQIEKGATDANGADATTADDGSVHVIPVAIGAVTVAVRLPDGCTYAGATNKPLDGNRPAMTNVTLEKVFAGEIATWGDAVPGISCAAAPIKRVVRLDSSGTTFAFKQLLAAINPTRGWSALGNTAWPNDSGATAVVRGASNGNGPLATALGNTQGGIGYGDLGGIRNASSNLFRWTDAADVTFWLPLQRRDTVTYDDPQAAADGYKSTSTARGANCATVTPRNVPTSSLGDWSKVDSTYTTTGYGACTLTYVLAFDDNSTVYCNSAGEERKARSVKDYLELGVVSVKGQQSLTTTDYDSLPGFTGSTNATPGSLYATARMAVASIGWKKTGGRPCTTQQPSPDPTPTPTPTPPGGGTNNAPPPPAPISNAFTISSARVSGTTIRLSLQLPGAGKVSVASSTKPKKGKAINLATKTATATAAGAQTLSVALSSKAKSALRKDKKLKVTLKITYTPNGGQAKTITRSVTVKQAKKKS